MNAPAARLSPQVRSAVLEQWQCMSADTTAMLLCVERAIRLHDAAALAESARGRGPHAAAVLRWAANRAAAEGRTLTNINCTRWADEAEQGQP